MINSNLNLEKHWEGEHSFWNSSLKGPHSHSLAPCAPAFLAGATGRRRRVPKNEGQQHLYSPSLGHPLRPRRQLSTHRALRRATPTLLRAPVHPSSGTCPPPSGARLPFVGHPSGCPSALLAHWISRATLVAPSGISFRLLRRATPSGPPFHSLYKYPCLPWLRLYYFFMEIHMAKNTKYLTMALTHKKNYHILWFNVGKKY
jgi:hypothetical protein